jgi:hypothetical protein
VIRDATLDDMEDLLFMGERFFTATQYGSFVKYSEDRTRNTLEHLISDDNGILLVNEKVNGVVGAMVYPFYLADSITGQELFWWCEEKGQGLELLTEVENRAKELGAETFTMVSLDGLGHERLDKIYTESGYIRSEHSYIKGL